MIIGICGGTGSGKTTVANRILESVSADEVVFIQQDLYYRDLKDMPLDYRNAANFDHPDALDNDLLVNHLKRLNAGEPVELPIYDFRTHSRLPATTLVDPKPIVIEEYIGTVRPMHIQFIEPSKRFADVIIPEGGHNLVSIDLISGKIRERLANSLHSMEGQ